MSNTLTAYVPTIISRTLKILRERLVLLKSVTTDYDAEMASIGQTIQIPVTAALSVASITPAATPPALTSIAPSSVSITLNKFEAAPMSLTASDLNQMMNNSDFVPAHLEEGARNVAKSIEDTLFLQYKNIPYYVGTAGTNPFATSLATLALAAKSLDDTLASDQRTMIISNAAKEKALELGNLIQSYQRGGNDTLNKGQLGELLGFDMQRGSQVPTHTAGTITTGLAVKTSTVHAVGVSSIVATTAASTGACALKAGDIILISGDTQTYTLTADATQATAATDVTLSIYPPLKVATAGGEAITVKASHVVNLGFDRGAFALAMRQPRNPEKAQNVVIPFSDSGEGGTGMQFFLSMVPGYWAETLEVGALYGCATLRPERAVRMAG
jgi:hypothetical protein